MRKTGTGSPPPLRTHLRAEQRGYLQNADALQADWNRDNTIDHTMIVTAVGGNGERYLAYHPGDTHNRKLSSLAASYPSAWWYAHRP